MYSNLSNLRQHIRLIHHPQSVTCPLCNKPFKTKLYLKRHLISFHELSVADIQRQEEIYHHQVKVQVQKQGQTQIQSGAQAQNQTQVQAQTQAQIQPQTQMDSKVLLMGPASTPRVNTEESEASTGGGNTTEPKLRSYQTQAEDNAYSMEMAQIDDSKHFTSGMLQFDATYH